MHQVVFTYGTQEFVERLDAAAQAHMAWSHRLLRCAILKSAPGDDALAEDAHLRCAFGKWFQQCREHFDGIEPLATQRLEEHHRQMHNAARSICRDILSDSPGNASIIEDFERTQAAVIADLAILKTQLLARSARLDSLTGLPLRYGLDEEFKRCRAQTLRRSALTILMLLDVDHFKCVNDVHGHAAGDLALQHVANMLRSHCRTDESLFRYGGEEFIALLQVSDRDLGFGAADRLLQVLRDNPLRLPDGHMLSLTVSAGMAEVGPEESLTQAVTRADRALYAAKLAGRDNWKWVASDTAHGQSSVDLKPSAFAQLDHGARLVLNMVGPSGATFEQ